MRTVDLRPEAVAAVAAVRAALTVVAERQRAGEITEKGHLDFATGTDVDSQDAIRGVLSRSHPEHAFVGEELGLDVAVGARSCSGAPGWVGRHEARAADHRRPEVDAGTDRDVVRTGRRG